MTATATITAPTTEEAPLYRRAETRLAVVGKGKRIHYSANDDALCGKAITRYTDAEEAARLDYEHCGRCIRIAEDRAYSISLAGASPLMAALHDVVDTVEAVDAQRAAEAETADEEAPAENAEDDTPAAADPAEQATPQADDEPAEWCGTQSRGNFLHRFTPDLYARCNRRIQAHGRATQSGVLVGHDNLRPRAHFTKGEFPDLYTFCPRCLATLDPQIPADDATPTETPDTDATPPAPADEPAKTVAPAEGDPAPAADETDENTRTFPTVDAPADAIAPAAIRPGDLVEGVIASTRPRTIRVRVDRAPWPINDRCTVLCDGRGVDAVYTHTLRLAGGDAEADGATPADVPAALATFARIASTPAPAAPAASAADDEPPAEDAPQADADDTPADVDQDDEPEAHAVTEDDTPAIPADLIRLSINPRSGSFHLGAMTEHGPAIICGQYVSPSLAPISDDTAHSMCPTCERSLALYLLVDADFEPERRLPEGTKSTAIAHYVFPDQGRTYCGKTAGGGTPGKKARVCSKCDGHRAGLVAFRAATGDIDAA